MNIKTIDFDGIYIKKCGDEVKLGFSSKPQECRCRLLLDMEIKKGNDNFEIVQNPLFETCGIMLDVSRGGVMKVESVCRIIDDIVSLGMNMIMLYTENVYTMEKYPMFGYMQGRYSMEELQEIDRYAAEKDVEVIPCIQTLAHLSNYLKWHEIPSDNAAVLLVGDEKCYEFIEEEIKTMRKAFRSNRIHIGMDEAFGLGLGNYLKKNGYRDEIDIFNEHLERVLHITDKYKYEAMIWSDMCYGSSANFYAPNFVIPQKMIDNAPTDVTHVFWDYYHTDYAYYDQKLNQEARFSNKKAFAGGIWTWDGFLPNFRHTYRTMAPALECAIDHKIDTIIATMWGNDGCETDYHLARTALPIFSEYCYRGKECTLKNIYEVSETLGGEVSDLTEAVSDFWLGEKGTVRIGKAVIYCDLLIDTFCSDYDWSKIITIYENALEVIQKNSGVENYAYYEAVFDAALGKARIMSKLRPAYTQKNKRDLTDIVTMELPLLRKKYRKLYENFKARWFASNKAFGFERFGMRFGGMDLRMEYVQETIEKYLKGEIDVIEELEEKLESGLNLTKWKSAGWFTGFD